jgi:hypothetical protein
MSNYRRLISYIYAYEGGIKGKNIGFAKIEVRNGQCRIHVNVKKIFLGSSDIGVYLLSPNREILLGRIFIRNGAGEFRVNVSAGNVEGSGCTMEQCYGLTIHETENTWRTYTTIWEDAVTQAAEVELADVTSDKVGVQARQEPRPSVSEEIKRQLEQEDARRDAVTPWKEIGQESKAVQEKTAPDHARFQVITGMLPRESSESSTDEQAQEEPGTGSLGERAEDKDSREGKTDEREEPVEGTGGGAAREDAERLTEGSQGALTGENEEREIKGGERGKTEEYAEAQTEEGMGEQAGISAEGQSVGRTGEQSGGRTGEQSGEGTGEQGEGRTGEQSGEGTGEQGAGRTGGQGVGRTGEQSGEGTGEQGVGTIGEATAGDVGRQIRGGEDEQTREDTGKQNGEIAGRQNEAGTEERTTETPQVPFWENSKEPWVQTGQSQTGMAMAQKFLASKRPADGKSPGERLLEQLMTERPQTGSFGEENVGQSRDRVQERVLKFAKVLMQGKSPGTENSARQETILETVKAGPRPVSVIETTPHTLPEPGDPARLKELERQEKEEAVQGTIWGQLQRRYPKVLAFDYVHGSEILTIKPQDIGILPRENWVYGNNSFLLHGYYNYRHLILARLEIPGGTFRYLLGVPGHYFSNEKNLASMFGFPNFVLAKKQPEEDGRFGYWYTDLRL